MKKLLILLIPIIISSCVPEITPEDFFINEDFVLLNKYQKEKVMNGQTRTIRTWEIIRLNQEGDSIYFGIIDDSDKYTSSCASKDNTIITDELWKIKKKGSILHFDYINKDRFHKRPKIGYTATAIEDNVLYSNRPEEEIKYVNEGTIDSESREIINMNKLEIERKIMDIERQIESLNREKDKLKESLK